MKRVPLSKNTLQPWTSVLHGDLGAEGGVPVAMMCMGLDEEAPRPVLLWERKLALDAESW